MAGKGPRDRTEGRKKWDSCPLWDNLKKNKERKEKDQGRITKK
jgi:hypothetical protein